MVSVNVKVSIDSYCTHALLETHSSPCRSLRHRSRGSFLRTEAARVWQSLGSLRFRFGGYYLSQDWMFRLKDRLHYNGSVPLEELVVKLYVEWSVGLEDEAPGVQRDVFVPVRA